MRRVAGYARDGRGWLLTDRLEAPRRNGRFVPSPVIDYYLRITYHLGCPTESYKMELWTTPDDEAAADGAGQRLGLAGRRPLVLLNPGAAFGAAKFWPTEHFAELARRLVERRAASVLVLCGPKERDIARSIVRASGVDRVVSLADEPVSIGLTKACVRRSHLLVTTDSGPRHFAAAFDVPEVTIFGPTHIPWTDTYFGKAIYLQHEVDCGPCQQRVCKQDHRCMRQMRPETVYGAAAELLDRYGPAAAAGSSQEQAR